MTFYRWQAFEGEAGHEVCSSYHHLRRADHRDNTSRDPGRRTLVGKCDGGAHGVAWIGDQLVLRRTVVMTARSAVRQPRSLLRVVEDDPERVAAPVAQTAHAVAHVDAVDPAPALHRAVMDRENHARCRARAG